MVTAGLIRGLKSQLRITLVDAVVNMRMNAIRRS